MLVPDNENNQQLRQAGTISNVNEEDDVNMLHTFLNFMNDNDAYPTRPIIRQAPNIRQAATARPQENVSDYERLMTFMEYGGLL